jgi:hypothetical protein
LAFDGVYEDPRIERLIALRAELLERGWGKGTLVQPISGSVCILGALHAVHGNVGKSLNGKYWQVLDSHVSHAPELKQLLGRPPGEWETWWQWNDCGAWSCEDVIEKIDERIAELQAAKVR